MQQTTTAFGDNQMMKICAITNVFNERFNLPIWLRYYGTQVGIENCIVIDDLSNDGSTQNLGGASLIKLPRAPFDDFRRANLISDLANAMLRSYDAVIYSDCDELAVADPRRFSSLAEFCESMTTACEAGIGLNLLHKIDSESAIRANENILKQRSYVQFVSPMCKPIFVRDRVTWGGGFHSSNFPLSLTGLYVFHLRWVDLGECFKRLDVTRNLIFKDLRTGVHQRLSIAEYIKKFLDFVKLPVDDNSDFLFDEFVKVITAEQRVLSNGKIGFPRDLRSTQLFTVPPAFTDLF